MKLIKKIWKSKKINLIGLLICFIFTLIACQNTYSVQLAKQSNQQALAQSGTLSILPPEICKELQQQFGAVKNIRITISGSNMSQVKTAVFQNQDIQASQRIVIENIPAGTVDVLLEVVSQTDTIIFSDKKTVTVEPKKASPVSFTVFINNPERTMLTGTISITPQLNPYLQTLKDFQAKLIITNPYWEKPKEQVISQGQMLSLTPLKFENVPIGKTNIRVELTSKEGNLIKSYEESVEIQPNTVTAVSLLYEEGTANDVNVTLKLQTPSKIYGELEITPSLVKSGSPVTIKVKNIQGSVCNYRFNFGDGTPEFVSSQPIVMHTYNHAGGFDITVNLEGCFGDNFTGPSAILQSQEQKQQNLPDLPANLYEKETGPTWIKVQWDSAKGAKSYNLYLDNQLAFKGRDIPIFTFENLQPETLYLLGVSAVNEYGETEKVKITARTGSYGSSSIPAGTLKWTFATGAGVRTNPAIGSDGTIYVGSKDNKLYAIRPDGTEKWEFETTGIIDYSSPTIGSDGTIYIGSDDKKLYAINPDGTQKWSYATGGSIYSSPAISSDGTIYVGSFDNKLYAINPDGSKKWEFVAGNVIKSSPAIGSDGTIYVGSQDKNLYAVNHDGTKKWEFTTGNVLPSSPAIGTDGTIYVQGGDDKFYAINPNNGTQKWFYSTAGAVVKSSPSIGSDGTIYAGIENRLHAINPDGSKMWEFLTAGAIDYSIPAIGSDSTIYVGSNNNNLYAINPDGTQKWGFTTGNSINSSPAIGSDGTIYVGSGDKKLYAIISSSNGLATSAWPKFHKDNKNIGSNSYTLTGQPVVTSISKSTATINQTLTILGSNFSTNPSTNCVFFNNMKVLVESSTSNTLTIKVPTNSPTGTIIVKVNTPAGWATLASQFCVVGNVPQITGFNTTNAPIGAPITITGNHFSTIPTDNKVYFNGVLATVTSSTYTQINTTVPTGATTGPVQIQTEGGIYQTLGNFTVNVPPTVNNPTADPNPISGSSYPTLLKCVATDPNGDILSYTWSTDGGSFGTFDPSNTGSEVYWFAPTSGTSFTLRVSVSDGINPPVQKTVMVNVNTGGSNPGFNGGYH